MVMPQKESPKSCIPKINMDAQRLVSARRSQRLMYVIRQRLELLNSSEVQIIDENLVRFAGGSVPRRSFAPMPADIVGRRIRKVDHRYSRECLKRGARQSIAFGQDPCSRRLSTGSFFANAFWTHTFRHEASRFSTDCVLNEGSHLLP
jgi:hypothetical protein